MVNFIGRINYANNCAVSNQNMRKPMGIVRLIDSSIVDERMRGQAVCILITCKGGFLPKRFFQQNNVKYRPFFQNNSTTFV